MKNFDLEYDLKLFREEETELFSSKTERFHAPISDGTAILMLKIIDGLENEINKLERIEELNDNPPMMPQDLPSEH